MKRAEIITLFTLFASVFVLVGVLRYLNLYEGMEAGEEEKKEEVEPHMVEGLDVPAAPPSPPASSPTLTAGPTPAAEASGSVLKFSTF